MQEIIKKAMEGGYPDVLAIFGEYPAMYRVTVCEPKFWQALSKECGWEDQKVESEGRLFHPQFNRSFSYSIARWKWEAQKFHEINLQSGFEKAVEWLSGIIFH